MKITKSLVAALLIGAGSAVSAFAQGQVNFVTYNGGNTTQGRFYASAGVLADGGNNFVGQLWAGSSSSSDSAFTAVAAPFALSTASSGTGAGYILQGGETVNGSTAASSYNFEIRVWNTADSATWLNSMANGAAHGSAATPIFSAVVSGGSVTPPLLNTFANVTLITSTPEPATLAMLGLGAASLLIVRRRK